MRKLLVLTGAFVLVSTLLVPAHGKVKTKTLGTDPAGDAPPALDITYLKAGRLGAKLYIEIGIDKMIPPFGGYPRIPGIEWIFDVGERTFVAEAVADRTPAFYLFEILESGAAKQLASPEGGYAWTNGYIHMLVPLKDIGARRGSVISGTDDTESGGDVDSHVHHAGTSYADVMATEKDFVVP